MIVQKTKSKFRYRKVHCQYCNNISKVIKGITLYGECHKLSEKEFYYCRDCSAWVGMHSITKKPFGTLANKELRQKRVLAHSLFDKIWKEKVKNGCSKSVARMEAYSWLADKMNLTVEKCHIGYFGITECNKVMSLCLSLKK